MSSNLALGAAGSGREQNGHRVRVGSCAGSAEIAGVSKLEQGSSDQARHTILLEQDINLSAIGFP